MTALLAAILSAACAWQVATTTRAIFQKPPGRGHARHAARSTPPLRVTLPCHVTTIYGDLAGFGPADARLDSGLMAAIQLRGKR